MKRKNKKFNKRPQNPLNKLSLFQKSDARFSKKCPLSIKNAPIIDYKNISLLKKYTSDNGKIISSKIANKIRNFIKKKAEELRTYLLEWLKKNNSKHYQGVENRKLI